MDMLTPIDLKRRLTELGIAVALEGERLRFRPAPPPELRPEIEAHKPELLKLLKAEACLSGRQDRPAGPEPVPSKAVHREHVEMMESLAMLRQAKEQLHKEIEQEAQRLGWPSLVLAPWARIPGGAEAWATFLTCPCHSPDQYQLVVEALRRSGGEADDTP